MRLRNAHVWLYDEIKHLNASRTTCVKWHTFAMCNYVNCAHSLIWCKYPSCWLTYTLFLKIKWINVSQRRHKLTILSISIATHACSTNIHASIQNTSRTYIDEQCSFIEALWGNLNWNIFRFLLFSLVFSFARRSHSENIFIAQRLKIIDSVHLRHAKQTLTKNSAPRSTGNGNTQALYALERERSRVRVNARENVRKKE